MSNYNRHPAEPAIHGYPQRGTPRKTTLFPGWSGITSGGEQVDHEPRYPGHERGRRNGEDPGPDDSARHAPAHGGEALDRADPHDRAGDRVGGADGNSP